MVSPIYIAAVVSMLAGVTFVLITHFFGIPGGLIWGPVLFTTAVLLGMLGGNVRNPVWYIVVGMGLVSLFIAIDYYDFLGLQGSGI